MKLESRYKITRDEDHAYSVDDGKGVVLLPGVTGILDTVGSKDKLLRIGGWMKKQALLKVADHLRPLIGKQATIDEAFIEAVRKSAWKRDKELLKEAGDIGTRVHAAIDAFIMGQEPILDDDTRQGYYNFQHWLLESKIKLIKGDTFVASIKMGYGGALDAIGEKNGRLTLLDFKTSNYIQDAYSLQTGGYVMAFEETYSQDIDKAIVIRFGKEKAGDFEHREVNLLNATKAFMFALDLKKMMDKPLWMEAVK